MNNDLISREALINEIDTWGCNDYDKYDFIEAINNAPTVDVFSEIDGLNNQIDDLSENLAWYINERNRLLKEQRPQGKWIRTALYGNTCLQCNQCGKADFDIKYDNYCPKCGADMRDDPPMEYYENGGI